MGTTPPGVPPPGVASAGGPAALWARFRALPIVVQIPAWVLVLGLALWLVVLAGSPADQPTVEVAESDITSAEEADEAEPEAADEVEEPDPEPDTSPEPDPEPAATTTVAGDLEVHFIDVGQADATLLVHDEVAVLIDAGHWQRSDVVPYLRSQGVDALDLVVVTHPHADHIGQFDQVLDAFEVDEVWWSGSETTSQTFERSVAALEASTAVYEEPRAGDTTTLGPLGIEVLNPPVGVGLADLHDASLALRITYGEVRLLFTGDAEAATEARMVDQSVELLAADVLQLGHHGSRTSTTAGFLSIVDPAIAIYSAGAGNSYGHPHGEVVSRVTAAGTELYGTDVHGSVLVTTDGSRIEVETGVAGSVKAAPAPAGSGGGGSSTPAPEPEASPSPSTSDGCGPGQVDINAAGSQQLQEITHIGPGRAEQIPGLRPFVDVESLDRIPGIAAGRLADIVAQGLACAG